MSDSGPNLEIASNPDADEAERVVNEIRAARVAVEEQLRKRIVGQDEVVRLLLVSLFARGHCLFVGVPGLAKTLLISTLAEALNLTYKRIQFTPDLMPSDITGTEILEEDHTTGKRFFRFIQGPVFANIILADEVNRTPPKTQAALLQAMQEYQVTAAGTTHTLTPPFLVFATQNPIEQEGTYPLPEAQLDRFMFSVDVPYPDLDEEVQIVESTTTGEDVPVDKVLDPQRIVAYQKLVYGVPVAEHVVRYAVRLVQSSRPGDKNDDEFLNKYVSWGAGPRASQYLVIGGKALALLDGRYAVSVDDIKALAVPVLKHRIIPNFHAEAERIDSLAIIEHLLAKVPV
ncbi:MAG TPA: MoxR family ATPase [Myxococcales bacterium]|nr:MoxR family ATPase [Myxococcales bacterium]HIN85413.1 MoxR family ATPase [Myxococcales bacterium]